jgi:4-alpha-glucanotransferase
MDCVNVKRRGVLLPIFSLPGPDGIGTIGRPAHDFVEFLVAAGQDLWQILPIGPSDEEGSPYRGLSAFDGDPLLIDLAELKSSGLLSTSELDEYYAAARSSCRVDYAHLRKLKLPLLHKAAERANTDLQKIFFAQWDVLRARADKCGIGIAGDIPFYVSGNSVDCITHPELFSDKFGGVPPDDYAPNGQAWNEPVYNWRVHKKSGYAWWKERIAQAARLYSACRLDHFRGFADYYEIKPGGNAVSGKWRRGPGREIIDALKSSSFDLDIFPEDLGYLSRRALKLLDYSGWPGMRVLQFAFDPKGDSAYLPHNHIKNCVVCTGTHDNDTLAGWVSDMSASRPDVIERAREYFGVNNAASLPEEIIRAALGSVADTAIIPLQDWLGLGSESRINTPGTVGAQNWTFRISEDMLTEKLARKMRIITEANI